MQYFAINRTNRSNYIKVVIYFLIFLIVIFGIEFLILKFLIHAKIRNILTLFYFMIPLISLGAVPGLIILTIGRLRDLDASLMWIILLIVPGVNILFVIFLALAPGTKGTNQYGPSSEIFLSKRKELLKQGLNRKQASQKIYEETVYP